MKNEVGTPVIIAVIVVALLVIGGIAWSVFGKKGSSGGTAADHAKWVQEHPESSMNKPPPNAADYKRGPNGGSPLGGSPMSGGR